MKISDPPTRRCTRAPSRPSARSRSRGSPTATSSCSAGRRRQDDPSGGAITPPTPPPRSTSTSSSTPSTSRPIDALQGGDPGLRPRLRRGRAEANQGFHYLNPFLSTSRRVFAELNSDQANLEGLVVDAASLTWAPAENHRNLLARLQPERVLGAIGSQHPARLRGRAAARLHAPVQHHLGQPQGRPR